jgi:hypothetical protein
MCHSDYLRQLNRSWHAACLTLACAWCYTTWVSKKRGRPVHGLFKRNFPRTVRQHVDQDYINKLTPEEREWLAKFNDNYYGAKFPKDEPNGWTDVEKRERYVAKNAANRDIYGISEAGGVLDVYESNPHNTAEASTQDFAPSPAYLESAEYKHAREAFRQHLKPHLEAQPKITPNYLDARETLEDLIPPPPSRYPTHEQPEKEDARAIRPTVKKASRRK